MSKEVVNWQQSDAYNAFTSGKAAMFESGTWQLADIDEKINGSISILYFQKIKNTLLQSVEKILVSAQVRNTKTNVLTS